MRRTKHKKWVAVGVSYRLSKKKKKKKNVRKSDQKNGTPDPWLDAKNEGIIQVIQRDANVVI
jgi:hypothetical protein